MKAFFLYTELADYTLQCMKVHLEMNPNDEIHVIHYPVNREAPFRLYPIERLTYYEKTNTDAGDYWELFNEINPDIILCSGWNDRSYNKFVKAAGKLVPVVLCFDNYFRYTLKQLVGVPVARVLFRGVYDAVWVPGNKQKKYARILGFKESQIHTCFYSTDTRRYTNWYKEFRQSKQQKFPHRLLCVARYIPQKGLPLLWSAFAELCDEMDHDWELVCAGAGEGFEDRMIHNRIKHLGFIQPGKFGELIGDCGVFVLPSYFEPWGVVLNEFASSGFPMIVSNKVGSSDLFLEEGRNGFVFKSGNKGSLKEALRNVFSLSDAELLEMSEHSAKMAEQCTALNWSARLSELGALISRA